MIAFTEARIHQLIDLRIFSMILPLQLVSSYDEVGSLPSPIDVVVQYEYLFHVIPMPVAVMISKLADWLTFLYIMLQVYCCLVASCEDTFTDLEVFVEHLSLHRLNDSRWLYCKQCDRQYDCESDSALDLFRLIRGEHFVTFAPI